MFELDVELASGTYNSNQALRHVAVDNWPICQAFFRRVAMLMYNPIQVTGSHVAAQGHDDDDDGLT